MVGISIKTINNFPEEKVITLSDNRLVSVSPICPLTNQDAVTTELVKGLLCIASMKCIRCPEGRRPPELGGCQGYIKNRK